jgi:hypothetical protein
MEKMDKLYIEVISYLFDVHLSTSEELDDFYMNIKDRLSDSNIERLQAEMANVLHRGMPSFVDDSDDTEDSLVKMVEACPKVGEVKKLVEVVL